ncbi:hypothetical protein AAE478_009458 [Parahypoxylon ruwenzoriense]
MVNLRSLCLMTVMSITSLAMPHENMTELDTRARGMNCGGHQYSLSQADDAWGDGIARRRSGRYVYNGRTPFPEEFRNGQAGRPEVDPSPCAGLQLYEFPILSGGAEYNGGNPGPDRVVFADSRQRPGSYEHCFLMTHTGARGNLFVKCT